MVNNGTDGIKAMLKSYLHMVIPMTSKMKASMKVVILYLRVIGAVIVLYLCGWLIQSYRTETINLQDLLNLLDRLTAGQMLLALGFVATCMVDVDGDGNPDKLERDAGGNVKDE